MLSEEKKYANFDVKKEDTTLIIHLNNPPQNSLGENVFNELQEIVETANNDKDIISVIITSALPKIFTVGADVKELLQRYGTKRKMKNAIQNLDLAHDTYNTIESSPKPFIIAYQGLSYGGGIELGCACDIRIASEDSTFAMPEMRIAFIPGYGGTQRLPRLIGYGAAKKLIYTGEPIDASTAQKIGLIDEVVPKGKTLESALNMAKNIAKGCPSSIAFSKRSINEGLNLSLQDGLEREKEYFMENALTLEWNEGLFAFIGKREPNFKRIGKEEQLDPEPLNTELSSKDN